MNFLSQKSTTYTLVEDLNRPHKIALQPGFSPQSQRVALFPFSLLPFVNDVKDILHMFPLYITSKAPEIIAIQLPPAESNTCALAIPS